MKTRSLISAGIAGVALLSILAASVASNGETNENKIRIAYFPNVGHAIPIVGMEKGFFQNSLGDQVKIETRVFDSGPQAIESLFSNSIDLAYVGPGPAINGFINSENHNVRILAGAASGGASFVVHPDSEINSASDFAGKKIAAPQIGNTQDVSLRHYLSENGLRTAEKGGSVIVYNIPNPDIYTLFAKGDVDGAWVPEPWATILVTELNGKRLFHEEVLWTNQEFASVLLIANVDFVEKNPELIANLLKSHNETADWINQNPVETRIIFNDFLNSHLGQSPSDDVVDVALSNIVITADPLPDSVYSFAEKANALGYLGRNGYDLSGIFYYFDTNSIEGE
ncbi:MAG: ABC transporter substrate-binding protein [Nitrosopumilus sp.]|nr:ABC transporter substrate-binding protein [Nitrosopumilus sp.]MDF2423049.1 ABC transporter substrate-binding protein [Nitrosopumilus sp.]MDF2424321.1 ABC transporter substrate-binding protein [Nitrosopumilus sp.]MDF2425323.1 ABC transporter substrate-binding protein [Nitrosopumilus sp.]MDF2427133.1 ABC transporter substrate-binding protein [Nitrosopumilus sp.]